MKLRLNNVRLAFPNLFEATEFKAGDGKARYDATFLVEPGSANDKAIKAAILTAATETYDKKAPALLKSFEGQSNKYCYLDGDTKEYDGFAGHMFLSCHRKEKDGAPSIFDRNKAPLKEADGKPYAGCYVNAIVEIFAQKGEFPGIRASFSGVQFFADGEAFSGSRAADADDFEDLAEGTDADDFA